MSDEMRSANQVTRALQELGDGPAEARFNQQLRRFQASETQASEPQSRRTKNGFGLPVWAWSGLSVAALAAVFVLARAESPFAGRQASGNAAGGQISAQAPIALPAFAAASAPAPVPEGALGSVLSAASSSLENPARQPLRAHSGDHYLSAGDELLAPSGDLVDFGNAGVIQLKAQSQGKVLELNQDSFAMRLDRGKLDAKITKGLGNHFRILASGFEVQVIGTVFSVEWQPRDSKFNVAVTRGQVSVTDLQNGQRTLLSAGQSFSAQGNANGNHVSKEVQSRTGSSTLRGTDSKSAKSTTHQEFVPKSTSAGTLESEPSSIKHETPEPSRQISRPEWQLLAEAGEYQAAYSAAKGVGIAQLRTSATPSELLLLADSARLSGAIEDAKQTLLTLRNRYPSHQSAGVASFVLGRIAFEQHQDAEAISWLHSYLSEQPKGPLAEGARARMLTVTQRSSNQAAQRVAAEDYLKFHPTGQRAEAARRILGK